MNKEDLRNRLLVMGDIVKLIQIDVSTKQLNKKTEAYCRELLQQIREMNKSL